MLNQALSSSSPLEFAFLDFISLAHDFRESLAVFEGYFTYTGARDLDADLTNGDQILVAFTSFAPKRRFLAKYCQKDFSLGPLMWGFKRGLADAASQAANCSSHESQRIRVPVYVVQLRRGRCDAGEVALICEIN